jgi:hypothetical protein
MRCGESGYKIKMPAPHAALIVIHRHSVSNLA